MSRFFALVLCAQALLIQAVFGQCGYSSNSASNFNVNNNNIELLNAGFGGVNGLNAGGFNSINSLNSANILSSPYGGHGCGSSGINLGAANTINLGSANALNFGAANVSPLSVVENVQSLGGFGGYGTGEVQLIGELPLTGLTNVVGSLPVIGNVLFNGNVPAGGVVSIVGSSPYNCYQNTGCGCY